MQVKTLLNRVPKFKSVGYVTVGWAGSAEAPEWDVQVAERANGRALCSGGGDARPGDDRLARRRFELVPLWGVKVFRVYAPRRVDCPGGGVRVEPRPWGSGKSRLTQASAGFLARWARRLSWKEVAPVFCTSWDRVFRSVERAVEWGRAHQELELVRAIGIDEIAWRKGHKDLTLADPIDRQGRCRLGIGRERQAKTLLSFFRWFGTERREALNYIGSDRWKPYLKVIAKQAGQAVPVLDRFHIMTPVSKALDPVRAEETKRLKAKGLTPVLTKTRGRRLKRPENLTDQQETKLAERLRYHLRSVRASLLKEAFQLFWSDVSPDWASRFLDRWCPKTMRSKIEPMKQVAKRRRGHRPLLLNGFRAKGPLSSGVVEGFNTTAKLTSRRSFGFRTFHGAEIAS